MIANSDFICPVCPLSHTVKSGFKMLARGAAYAGLWGDAAVLTHPFGEVFGVLAGGGGGGVLHLWASFVAVGSLWHEASLVCGRATRVDARSVDVSIVRVDSAGEGRIPARAVRASFALGSLYEGSRGFV